MYYLVPLCLDAVSGKLLLYVSTVLVILVSGRSITVISPEARRLPRGNHPRWLLGFRRSSPVLRSCTRLRSYPQRLSWNVIRVLNCRRSLPERLYLEFLNPPPPAEYRSPIGVPSLNVPDVFLETDRGAWTARCCCWLRGSKTGAIQ